MTVTYPLDLPLVPTGDNADFPGVVAVRVGRDVAVAMNTSEWTFKSQVQVHAGQRWRAEITLPIMVREDAEIWQAWLCQLNGQEGTFMLGDAMVHEPRGNWAGAPHVNGADQTGQSLDIGGLVEGATIAPGDRFQIGQRLYMHMGLVDAVADSNGEVTIDIFPRLRSSPGDEESIVTIAPKGLFRLSDNSDDLYSMHAFEYYEVSFSAVEAI